MKYGTKQNLRLKENFTTKNDLKNHSKIIVVFIVIFLYKKILLTFIFDLRF